MLTMPNIYDEFRRRMTSDASFVVRIVSGSKYWHLSNRAIDCHGFASYELIESIGPISEKLNIITREWGIAQVNIVIHNRPFFKSGETADQGMLLRPSDVFGNVYNEEIKIYIYPGSAANTIADCLLVFSGRVTDMPESDTNTLLLVASAENPKLNYRLPQTIISPETYPHVPFEARNRVVPIVYGDFSETDYLNGRGLIPCEQVESRKYIVADHPVKSISAIWWYIEELKLWAKLRDASQYNVTIDDDGVATINFKSNTDIDAYVWIYPNYPIYEEGYDETNHPWIYAVDRDENTYAKLIAGVSPGWSGVPEKFASMIFEFRGNYSDTKSGKHIKTRIRPQDRGPGEYDEKIAIELKYAIEPGYTDAYNGTTENGGLLFFKGTGGRQNMGELTSNDPWRRYYISGYELDYNYDWAADDDGIQWHLGTGSGQSGADGDPVRIYIGLRVNQEPPAGTTVGRVYEVRLRIPVRIHMSHFTKVRVLNYGAPESRPDRIIAVECEGRQFGSWIDAGNRSNVNNYNNGDLIVSGQYVIESILREVLDYASRDIDTASFDAIEEPSYHAPANYSKYINYDRTITESDQRKTAKEIIQEICREHRFAFYPSSAGRARIIQMSPEPLSIMRISKADFVNNTVDSIKFTRKEYLINKGELRYGLRPHEGEYIGSAEISDMDSQTEYGIYRAIMNIDGHGYDAVIGDQFGLFHWWFGSDSLGGKFLSRPHLVVEFRTMGIKYAHLEIGDWINFDHQKMDLDYKLFGKSWQWYDFLIIEKETTLECTQFMAVEPEPMMIEI